LREKIRNCVTMRSRRLGLWRDIQEDAMLNLRLITAGAALVMATGGAMAQSATDAAAGKPMPLLQILEKSQTAKPTAQVGGHVRVAKRKAEHLTARKPAKLRHLAAKEDSAPQPPAAVAPTASGAVPANIWPGLDATAGVAAGANATPSPNTAAPADSASSELVVGGQTVQVAAPDTVNDIDRAADRPKTAEDASLKNDFIQAAPAKQAAASAPAPHGASAVGSASWIAKVLAALGGAIAAGSTAWFMIGSTPRRSYAEASTAGAAED
jgi:hypothetical protein